jgi:hypothetical protein
VAAMDRWQGQKTGESGTGGAKAYFERCIAIVRPIRGRVLISATFGVTILAVNLKYTVEGSSWMFSIINEAMIAIGIGIALLSTALIISNEKQK